MRAVTIPVSAKTGVGGFVFPGDHVDLMLTQTVTAKDGGNPLKATETILRNIRVLATDQSTETTVEEGKTVVRAVRTVTLEVTPKMAEKVSVSQSVGTLSLSLRSLADNQAELDRAIADGSIKVPAGATKEQEEKFLSQAMKRPIDGGTTFVTGGDVSRFQRRNAPNPDMTTKNLGGPTATPQVAAAPQAGSRPYRPGPVVRVTRGNSTTEEVAGK